MGEHEIPLAVLATTFREAPTHVRAGLIAIDESDDSPSRALLAAGHLKGIVRVETCSRTEWLISSDTPQWSAMLLEGALLRRFAQLPAKPFKVRTGTAAAHYMLRVSAGLDSVAEGEIAVARQLVRAFDRANEAGTADRNLRLCWKHLELFIHHRREAVPGSRGVGVQALVASHLLERLPPGATVVVLGKGEIGHAVHKALGRLPGPEPKWYSRASLPQALEDARSAAAVVVCTGGPLAWLDLPARSDAPLCVDIGSPPQVRSSPGWKLAGLDELLAVPRKPLSDDERAQLETLVADTTMQVCAALKRPAPARTLAAIDAERNDFLHHRLPALLQGVPPADARAITRAVASFAHAIIRHARAPDQDADDAETPPPASPPP